MEGEALAGLPEEIWRETALDLRIGYEDGWQSGQRGQAGTSLEIETPQRRRIDEVLALDDDDLLYGFDEVPVGEPALHIDVLEKLDLLLQRQL